MNVNFSVCMLVSLSCFSFAAGNGETLPFTPDFSGGEAEWVVIPGSGDIDFVEVDKACPCPNGDVEYLGFSLLTPVEIRVTVEPRGLFIQAIDQNCSSLQQRWMANYEYTTQHEAGGARIREHYGEYGSCDGGLAFERNR